MRQNAINSGMSFLKSYGGSSPSKIIQKLEELLEKQDEIAVEMMDRKKESILVLIGVMANHLEPGNPKVNE